MAAQPHHYEPPVAYHYHNTPCKSCGKTARHKIHQGVTQMYTHDESGSTYTASTRDEMIAHIEELLGSEGSRELAQAMYTMLAEDGYATFDGRTFTLLPVAERDWLALLAKAEDYL